MSQISVILILSSLFVSPICFAKKHYVVFGGGGEPKDRSWTIFDLDMKSTGDFLKKNKGWSYEYAVNGGHSLTEAMLKSSFPLQKEKRALTQETYDQTLDKIYRDLQDGKYQKGDQLLVQINTHGAMTKRDEGQLSHKISSSNGLVDLDKLKKIFDLANKKGIHSALLDFSCYSGASLALSNPSTCVITGSGEFNVGYVNSPYTFSQYFLNSMGNGKSLENLFLEARAKDQQASYPSISTLAGKDIYNKLYKDDLHRYLFRWYNEVEKMVLNDNQCLDDQFLQKTDQVSKWAKDNLRLVDYLNRESRTKEIDEFRNSLHQYHKILQQMQIDHRAVVNMKELNFEHTFYSSFGNEKGMRKNVNNIILTKPNELFDKWIADGKLSQLPQPIAAEVDYYRQVRQKREEILKEHPEYEAQAPLKQRLVDNTSKLNTLARTVAKNERTVYDVIYRQSRPLDFDNPCKSFKI